MKTKLVQNEWNCSMNVKYCAVLLRDTKHQPKILRSPPLPNHASTSKRNSWLGLIFSFLNDCYRFVSHRPLNSFMYFFYIFIKPSYISQFFHFISKIFKILSFRLLPDKHVRILPIFGRTTIYLDKGIMYLKISMRKICLLTISSKK